MSVEPSELMSEVWTQWQGHVIHDVFPLGRYLGGSDHSGVFLTNCVTLSPLDVAIKLVPTDRVLAESLLPRWKMAGGIVHLHLLRLLQWGECQLDGLPYLYVVMEYADQTLAQVLQRRALTDDETREMLRPILEALAFMHGQNLVQGQLKPTNILVVGDQLKLASDTIRRVGEGTISAKAPTAYDPPEARNGSNSNAGDIWALGVCLLEALTRRAPSGWGKRSEAVALPADFSPAFRDVVARCLNPNPQNRPCVADSWLGPAGSGKFCARGDHSARGDRSAGVDDTRTDAAGDYAPASGSRSRKAGAVPGAGPESASLAHRSTRSGRYSCAGLDRSAHG